MWKAIKTSQGKPINAYAPSRHKPNVIIVATTNFSIDIARLTIKHLILRASLEDCRITFEKIWLRRCCSGSRQIVSNWKFREWSNSKLCCTTAKSEWDICRTPTIYKHSPLYGESNWGYNSRHFQLLQTEINKDPPNSRMSGVLDHEPIYVTTYMSPYIHIHIQTNLHTYIRTHIHRYLHTYIHTYIRAYTRIYIHT